MSMGSELDSITDHEPEDNSENVRMASPQFRGADPLVASVIARSETTKQSPYLARSRLFRRARNDIPAVRRNDGMIIAHAPGIRRLPIPEGP